MDKFVQGFRLNNGGIFWTRVVQYKDGSKSDDFLRWVEKSLHIS